MEDEFNASSFANNTDMGTDLDLHQFDKYLYLLFKIDFAFKIIILVPGTVLNMWVLAAILTSPDMRARMRNKLICSMAVLHLTDTLLRLPVHVVIKAKILMRTYLQSCVVLSVVINLGLIQDFVSNWTLVIIVATFLASAVEYNPATNLTPFGNIFVTVLLLLLPWVTSILTVPAIMKVYHSKAIHNWFEDANCIYPTGDADVVFKSIDTAIPLIAAAVLVSMATVLRRRMFLVKDSSASMKRELIGGENRLDPSPPYILAVVLSTICDLGTLLMVFDVASNHLLGSQIFALVSYTMAELRIFVMLLPWLLLPDFRERIKTWRPWYRPAPGIELTVAYGRDAS